MAESIETNIVSRRRIQFESASEPNQALQLAKQPQAAGSAESPASPENAETQFVRSPQSQTSGGPIMQHAAEYRMNVVKSSVLLAGAQPQSSMHDGDKESFTFTDYSGCFTDDGSPLIEQQGLSEPLLKRDRQVPPLHAALIPPSSQKDFSLVSQQLLQQQHELQKQLAQQQQHLQKLNVTLHDSAAMRASSSGQELSSNLGNTLGVSAAGKLLYPNAYAQGQSPHANSINSSDNGTHLLTSSPAASLHRSTQHLLRSPPNVSADQGDPAVASPSVAKESAQLGPSSMSQLEVAMHHFVQFREASHKKMNLLEQENMALKSKLQTLSFELQSYSESFGKDNSVALERRLDDLKMSYDQQLLDLQKHHAIENNRSFAQGMEVGQQKLMSTLAVAQSQIVDLRNASMEKDRTILQLKKDMQQSVMAKSLQELSEANTALQAQFGYREKYWLQEMNSAKAKIVDLEKKCEEYQNLSDSRLSERLIIESKFSRLLDIRHRLLSKLTSSVRIFHLRLAFDDWNRSLESIRVEQLLDQPRGFLRNKQPVSLPIPTYEPTQNRRLASQEQILSDSSSLVEAAAAKAGNTSQFGSVSNFLQGLWASSTIENPMSSGGPLSGIGSTTSNLKIDQLVTQRDLLETQVSPSPALVTAPKSFGAEPLSWPLKQIDSDFVNAAFLLAPSAVAPSQILGSKVETNHNRAPSGTGKATSSRTQNASSDSSEFHV